MKLTYTDQEGNLVVMSAYGQVHLGMAPENAIKPRLVKESEFPEDREFRNAWEDVGVIHVNMEKARELHKERLRFLRKPLLIDLDIAYMRADESGDAFQKLKIADKKQALRDITIHPAINEASTPEELKLAGMSVIS